MDKARNPFSHRSLATQLVGYFDLDFTFDDHVESVTIVVYTNIKFTVTLTIIHDYRTLREVIIAHSLT
jgi:hypothetical protein